MTLCSGCLEADPVHTKSCGHVFCDGCFAMFEEDECKSDLCANPAMRVTKEKAAEILEICEDKNEIDELNLVEELEKLQKKLDKKIIELRYKYEALMEEAKERVDAAFQERKRTEAMIEGGMRLVELEPESAMRTYIMSEMPKPADVCHRKMPEVTAYLKYDRSNCDTFVEFRGQVNASINLGSGEWHGKIDCVVEVLRKRRNIYYVRLLPKVDVAEFFDAPYWLSKVYFTIDESCRRKPVTMKHLPHPYRSRDWRLMEDEFYPVDSEFSKTSDYSFSKHGEFYTIRSDKTDKSVIVFCDNHDTDRKTKIYNDDKYVYLIINYVDEYVISVF